MSTLNVNCTCSVMFNWGTSLMFYTLNILAQGDIHYFSFGLHIPQFFLSVGLAIFGQVTVNFFFFNLQFVYSIQLLGHFWRGVLCVTHTTSCFAWTLLLSKKQHKLNNHTPYLSNCNLFSYSQFTDATSSACRPWQTGNSPAGSHPALREFLLGVCVSVEQPLIHQHCAVFGRSSSTIYHWYRTSGTVQFIFSEKNSAFSGCWHPIGGFRTFWWICLNFQLFQMTVRVYQIGQFFQPRQKHCRKHSHCPVV